MLTKALKLASRGIIPSEKYIHNPSLQNNEGYTVAMYLAANGIIPPKEW